MLNFLQLPNVQHVVFQNPPLVLALCQVQFTKLLQVSDRATVASFQQALQEEYPLLTEEEQVEFAFGIASKGPQMQTGARSKLWRFTDISDVWTVVLTEDFLTVETRLYADFNDFLSRLRQVLDAFITNFDATIGTRVGLRYINEIRPGHKQWTSVIKPELLGPLAMPTIAEHTNLAIQQVQLGLPNNQGATVQHGVIPLGSTIQPRSEPISLEEPFYLLDFDVFQQFTPQEALPMEVEAICQHVAEFNRTIYQLFRWFAADEYTAKLEVRRYDDD